MVQGRLLRKILKDRPLKRIRCVLGRLEKYPEVDESIWKRGKGTVRIVIGTGMTDRKTAEKAARSADSLARILEANLPEGYQLIRPHD